MSSALLAPPEDGAIHLYAPLPVQEPVISSPARYKLVRAGRRGSKSRLALYCACMGHGPEVDGQPLRKGMFQGGDILWLVRDFPQARAIWREEIVRRFEGADGVDLQRGEYRVEVAGGSLEIRTAENVDSIRGRRYDGVIPDEGAFFDLEYAWHEVVRPALADRGGWAMFPSTPNFGSDHARNEQRRFGPSYFNVLCLSELAGELGESWEQFHWTTRDNPKIDRAEVDHLYAEMDARPFARDQELDAKLLEGIEGVFFGEWKESVHVRKVQLPESGIWWGAGLDWGYSSPGWMGLVAHWQGMHGQRKHLVTEVEYQKMTPYEAGKLCGKALLPYPRPEFVAADCSMWDTGDGRGGRVEPIAEDFQKGMDDACGRDSYGHSRAPQLIPAPKGAGSREVRALAMREDLKYTAAPDGNALPWGMPVLSVDPKCKHFIRCIETLPVDPRNPEVPATEGVYDHPYDGKTYLDVLRKPEQQRVVIRPDAQDRSYSDTKFKVRMEDDETHRRFSGRRRAGGE